MMEWDYDRRSTITQSKQTRTLRQWGFNVGAASQIDAVPTSKQHWLNTMSRRPTVYLRMMLYYNRF